jgi:ABC-2 type transport system permease protein
MLSDTWLLITLRWRLNWNSFRSRKWYFQLLAVVGLTAIAIAFGAFSAGVGFTAGSLLRRFPELQLESLLPGLILTAVTLLLLLNSFGIALGSLFLSNDLELLMAAPVSRQAVFISKIADGMVNYYALSLVAAVPALVTYGIGLRYGVLYYLLTLITVLGTPLLPAGVGSLTIMVVARFAPARRVREAMGLFAGLVGLACSVISNTWRFWFGDNSSFNRNDFRLVLERLQQFANWPIPSFLAGKGLALSGTGDLLGALLNLSTFLVLTFGTFAVCVWLADSLYTTGWIRMQSSGVANRNKERAAKEARQGGLLGQAVPPLALALKDWRVIPRDLRNFAQFLAPLLFLPILYLNFFSAGRDVNPIQAANAWSGLDISNVAVAGSILFAVNLVFNRLAATSISMEGKSYWLLKTAPIADWELLLGKLITTAIPFAILSSVLFIGVAVWRGFTVLGTLYGLFGILLLGIGNTAIETGLAVPWANLDWDDPRRMQSGWGGLFAMITSSIMGLLAGSALCLPILLKAFLPGLELIGWIVGPALATVIVIAVAGPTLWIGLKRLPTVGESA